MASPYCDYEASTAKLSERIRQMRDSDWSPTPRVKELLKLAEHLEETANHWGKRDGWKYSTLLTQTRLRILVSTATHLSKKVDLAAIQRFSGSFGTLRRWRAKKRSRTPIPVRALKYPTLPKCFYTFGMKQIRAIHQNTTTAKQYRHWIKSIGMPAFSYLQRVSGTPWQTPSQNLMPALGPLDLTIFLFQISKLSLSAF